MNNIDRINQCDSKKRTKNAITFGIEVKNLKASLERHKQPQPKRKVFQSHHSVRLICFNISHIPLECQLSRRSTHHRGIEEKTPEMIDQNWNQWNLVYFNCSANASCMLRFNECNHSHTNGSSISHLNEIHFVLFLLIREIRMGIKKTNSHSNSIRLSKLKRYKR